MSFFSERKASTMTTNRSAHGRRIVGDSLHNPNRQARCIRRKRGCAQRSRRRINNGGNDPSRSVYRRKGSDCSSLRLSQGACSRKKKADYRKGRPTTGTLSRDHFRPKSSPPPSGKDSWKRG